MIKHYCDICGAELNKATCCSSINDWVSPVFRMGLTDQYVSVAVALNGKTNASDVCLQCTQNIVNGNNWTRI